MFTVKNCYSFTLWKINEIFHLLSSTKSWHSQVGYTIWGTWCVIIQNVNSGSVFWTAMESNLMVQWAGLVQSTLYASDVLDAQHKPVLCVFHTSFIGVTADIQLMGSMVHLNHCFLSSQTSWHHTSKETNVKHLKSLYSKTVASFHVYNIKSLV